MLSAPVHVEVPVVETNTSIQLFRSSNSPAMSLTSDEPENRRCGWAMKACHNACCFAGDEICAMPTLTSTSETAALVLVDRCLDCVTPLSHADHVLDQIYGILQRRHTSGHNSLRCRNPPLMAIVSDAEEGFSLHVTCVQIKTELSCGGRTSDVIVPLPSVFGSAKQSDNKEAFSDDGEAGPGRIHADEAQQPRQTSNKAGSFPASPV